VKQFFSSSRTLAVLSCTLLLLSCASSSDSHVSDTNSTDLEWYHSKQENHETDSFFISRVHVLRLVPGEDVLQSLFRFARVRAFRAASIVSVVGSLVQVAIRFANQNETSALNGHFEIVSLMGNIDSQFGQNPLAKENDGYGHMHLSVSDGSGVTYGGHMMSGCVVYTTAEITMLEIVNGAYKRVLDDGPGGSGYYELKVFKGKYPNDTNKDDSDIQLEFDDEMQM